MIKEIRYSKKPDFIINLEKKGGTNYKTYQKDHLTILIGLEPIGKKKSMIYHIIVNSKMRYTASKKELNEIAIELLPKGTGEVLGHHQLRKHCPKKHLFGELLC